MAIGRNASVEHRAGGRRATVVAGTIGVSIATKARTAGLCLDCGARTAAVGSSLITVLLTVDARRSRTGIRAWVADLVDAIRIRKALLSGHAALGARHTAAVLVGFIAILDLVRTTGFATSLRGAVADLALTVRAGQAFVGVRTRRTAAAAINVRFRWILDTIGTGGRLARTICTIFECAVVVGVAALTIGAGLIQLSLTGASAVHAGLLPILHAIATAGWLA